MSNIIQLYFSSLKGLIQCSHATPSLKLIALQELIPSERVFPGACTVRDLSTIKPGISSTLYLLSWTEVAVLAWWN